VSANEALGIKEPHLRQTGDCVAILDLAEREIVAADALVNDIDSCNYQMNS
jgi:hypothetical protein